MTFAITGTGETGLPQRSFEFGQQITEDAAQITEEIVYVKMAAKDPDSSVLLHSLSGPFCVFMSVRLSCPVCVCFIWIT